MADNKVMGGLPDPSKINQYGAEPTDIQEYQQSLKDSISALEQRYANPNWFNVAAGFFKPQLGGFGASLGSAAQALGENVEKQRESQLPIAQMRAQLAASKISMGQNKTAADMVREHEARGAPLHELPDLVAKLTQLGSPLAAGPKARLDEARKSQDTMVQRAQLVRATVEQELTKINSDLANHNITAEDAQAKRAALPNIPDVPDLFARPAKKTEAETLPTNKDTRISALVPAPGFKIDPATLNAVRVSDGADTTPADATNIPKIEVSGKTILPPTVDLSQKGLLHLTDPQIALKTEEAKKLQENGMNQFADLQTIGKTNFNELITPVNNTLRLLGYEPDPKSTMDPKVQQANKEKANELFGLMKGDAWKGVLTALNAGVGGKVGDMYINVNLPVYETWLASLPPKMQDYGREMIQNLGAIALAQQKVAGVNPNSARVGELHLYSSAAISPQGSTPQSALKGLLHLSTSLHQAKEQHDFVNDVVTNKHPDYGTNPNSGTKAWDAISSPYYKTMTNKWQQQHEAISKHDWSQ
jgi:hypothetical protein